MINLRALHCGKSRLPLFAIVVALWAALFMGDAKAQTVPGPKGGANSFSGQVAIIQMEHISVHVTGKGSPVILIPGLSSPRAVWDGVAPELAKKHTVYLVQVNGFGGDDPRANLQPGVVDGLVAEVHQLITEKKLQGAAVVGHSLGGLATLMLAKAHPGDVGKAMIVDALPWVGSIFFPGMTVEAAKPNAEAMRVQMAGLYGKPVPEAVLDAIATTNALKLASREIVKGWMAKADMRVSGQAMYEDIMVDLRGQLGAITAPVTVLVPWSAMLSEERALGFYRNEYAGTGKLNIIGVGDSGHFIMLDQPEAFRTALSAFLAS